MVSMYRCRAHVGEHEVSVEAPGNLADSSRFHQQNIILIRRELTGSFGPIRRADQMFHSAKLFLIQCSFVLANMCGPAGGNFCEILISV